MLSSRLLHIDCSERESKDTVSMEYLMIIKFAPVLYLEVTYLCIIKCQNSLGNIIFLYIWLLSSLPNLSSKLNCLYAFSNKDPFLYQSCHIYANEKLREWRGLCKNRILCNNHILCKSLPSSSPVLVLSILSYSTNTEWT